MKLAAAILFACLWAGSAGTLPGQQVSPSTPPPPPASPPAEPAYDPYRAQKNVEIGTFYFKKGNYDAAIDRFEEATHYQPNLAKPWSLMAEAYEKKHDYRRASDSYKKYLEIYPSAPDAASIKKRIGQLERKQTRGASKQASH